MKTKNTLIVKRIFGNRAIAITNGLGADAKTLGNGSGQKNGQRGQNKRNRKMENTTKKANYRLYENGDTEDIYAESMEDAIQQGDDWLRNAWADDIEPGSEEEFSGKVREIVYDEFGEIDEEKTDDGEATYFEAMVKADPYDDSGCDHEWATPHSVLGGCDLNPGVWSNGGTKITQKWVCERCGRIRTVVDYGCQRNPGDPLETEEIEEATSESMAWTIEQVVELGITLKTVEAVEANRHNDTAKMAVCRSAMEEIEENNWPECVGDDAEEWVEEIRAQIAKLIVE